MNETPLEQPTARPGEERVRPARPLSAASGAGAELAVFAVITAAAVVATWPLARYAGSRVPWNLIDSLENVWIFGWTAHALAHQPLRLFDANMFHPEHTTLAFAENMLGIGIVVAPVCWLTANPILATNLAARIGVLVLLALAVVAGVAVAALPARVRRVALLGSALLLAVETVGMSTPMVAPPPITAANRAVAWAPGAVLQLPTVASHPDGTFARETLLREPVQRYLSTAHYRPITNGYAAFLPASAQTLLARIQDLPSASSLRALQERGVGTVVVETDLAVGTPWAGTAGRLDAWPGVRLVAASPGVRVYDVTRAQL